MGNSNLKIIVLVVVFSLLVFVDVSAFGVSVPYSKNNPLYMYPGQKIDVMVNLQNCPSLSEKCEDKRDVEIVADLISGNEIAKIVSDKRLVVSYGSADKNLLVRVKIPSDVSVGNNYNIKLFFNSISENKNGNIQLGVGYNVEIPVKIIKSSFTNKKTMNSRAVFIIVLLALISIFLIFWFLRRKNKFK